MLRYTSHDESGGYQLNIVHGRPLTKKKLAQRIGQYEDTGMDPEEIVRQRESWETVKRYVAALEMELFAYRALGSLLELRSLLKRLHRYP